MAISLSFNDFLLESFLSFLAIETRVELKSVEVLAKLFSCLKLELAALRLFEILFVN